jgi:hypothetical protein
VARSFRRTFFTLLIAIAVLVWLALGPGARIWLTSQSPKIVSEIKSKYQNRVLIGSVDGDFWSGVHLNKVVVLADDNPNHLPILESDKVTLGFSFTSLLSGDFSPNRIHLDGFDAVLYIAEDGSVVLPDWLSSAPIAKPLHAGFALPSLNGGNIRITCENGVLEIIKRFPASTEIIEPVDLSVTRLAGSLTYVPGIGVTIETLTGDYLASPVTVRGEVPTDSDGSFDITANVGDLQLSSFFRDVEPLFQGSHYLPNGVASSELHFQGTRNLPTITGALDLVNTTIGNVTVDSSTAAVAYSAGVIELSGITSHAYGGSVKGDGSINLLSNPPVWRLKCDFEQVDLGKYLDANGYYAYGISGGFSGEADAGGDFKSKEALTCDATIRGTGGSYLSPFSSRFTMISGEPADPSTPLDPADLTRFDDIEAVLGIAQAKINVKTFHFVSNDLNVDADGNIGFDKSIQATGILSVPLDKARQSRKLGRFVSFLPDSMDRAELYFTLSGFLNQMEFNAQPTANLLRGMVDQGGDLLHDLGGAFQGNVSPNG